MYFPSPSLLRILFIISSSIFLAFIFIISTKFSTTLPIPASTSPQPTTLRHLAFGLLGSESAWHARKSYTQSWWRPNSTRGLLYLDTAPRGPWSPASPPYRVSRDLTDFLERTKALAPVMIRMVNGIMEAMDELDDGEVRWLVMGDDDSVFFVDNWVDVLAGYEHDKYYYIGGRSEFIMSNYWFSFEQGFGGAGFALSYPLAKALAERMEGCLTRYAWMESADMITMACVADLGVNLSPHKGIHQIDLHGDISGLLSSHPNTPLLSLHHLDGVEPIFPSMDRYDSTRHLMKAAAADQLRMLQQTICHHRPTNWSFSVSWGYSAHIYEAIFTRTYLQKPIETFEPWTSGPSKPPQYMMNTRPLTSSINNNDSCKAPHVFFFERVEEKVDGILTTYSRAAARGLPPCGGYAAETISEISVWSPKAKRKEKERCECCDVVRVDGVKAELKFRECLRDEIIA